MKSKILLGIGILALVGTTNANAISASYRAQMEKSGCTEINAGQGCNIHKSKASNEAHYYSIHPVDNTGVVGQLKSDSETVLGLNIEEAADYLLSKDWKPNDGLWHKGGYDLHLNIHHGVVKSAEFK